MTTKEPSKGGVVFRRFRWYKGKCYDAWEYGHQAWPIPVKRK